MTIERIVDLERYPVDRPGDPRYRELLEQGRRALAERSLFTMPGFVRRDMIAPMARELAELEPRSARFERARNAYDYASPESDWPESHPRSRMHPCAYHQILNYQIPNDALIREIYHWQPLVEFLRLLCSYETLHRVECPHLALSAKIAHAGDTDGWHYDSNDVVFSLLLQAPEAGGQFEYAPDIRSETEENYAAVAELFADPARHALSPAMAEGDFNVFQGDLSMHRVTPVEGERPRIVALFSYDRKPGMRYDQWYIEQVERGLPSKQC
jgi:hypothetical protein